MKETELDTHLDAYYCLIGYNYNNSLVIYWHSSMEAL